MTDDQPKGLLGGLTKMLDTLVDLAESAESLEGRERSGQFENNNVRGSWGVRIGGGGPQSRPVQPFNNPTEEEEGQSVEVKPRREPHVDVFDEGDVILALIEMPGVDLDHTEVNVDGDLVTVTGQGERAAYACEFLLPKMVDSDFEVENRQGIFELRFTPQ